MCRWLGCLITIRKHASISLLLAACSSQPETVEARTTGEQLPFPVSLSHANYFILKRQSRANVTYDPDDKHFKKIACFS